MRAKGTHRGNVEFPTVSALPSLLAALTFVAGSSCASATDTPGRRGPSADAGAATATGGGGVTSASGGVTSASGGVTSASGGVVSTSGGVRQTNGGSATAGAGAHGPEVAAGAGGAANMTGHGGSGASSQAGQSTSGAGTSAGAGASGSTGEPGNEAGRGGNTGGRSGTTPQLPAISVECPTFATSTVEVGGLRGISLQVGAKKQGTGSLLFYWHGTGSTAGEVNALLPAAVRKEILDAGGIIVSFQGSLGTGGDCSGTATFSKDDFEIADQIAACAVRDHGIDPRRIYTTGCSAGGLQAGCMGALRSSYIAATAPNSGGEVLQQPIQDPANTPAVMTMHGGTSDRVIVSFASTSATYDEHMKGAGSFVVNCNHGGGHCGAPSDLYSAAWEFMKAHPFGESPDPYAAGLPASFPSYCEIF